MNTLTELTCLKNVEVEDDIVKQIKADLQGKNSILEMMKEYTLALKGTLDNDALPFRKLHRLFQLGSTPDALNGHYYGIVPGLRTGDLHGVAADIGNVVGSVWGVAISDAVPWVGKSFEPMSEDERTRIGGDSLKGDFKVCRGINHFHVIKDAPLNVAANKLLTFMWGLKKVPEAERQRFGHERNGGHFAAYRSFSIHKSTPKEVFCLNYRFPALGNVFPLIYLIDEMVEIADSLYLGQVIFATARLLKQYDPALDPKKYRYQHFGYFLLLGEGWNEEARRFFPYLDIPTAGGGVTGDTVSPILRQEMPKKFTTLTLADPPDCAVDPGILNEIRKDISEAGSIIHMFKSYSDTLQRTPTTQSPPFTKLRTLFNAGAGPVNMDGFFRGALISFQSHELLAAFNINTLNKAWRGLRHLSPWTGKRFDPVDKARLAELTEGYEKHDVPTFCGSNTVVFRTPMEKMIKAVMKTAGVWMEDASEEEQRLYGYQKLTYFFIGKQTKSILTEDEGKPVFQFNYRWKPLKNLPPDNYCVDQIVQIAEGLYLGELIYATDWLEAWNPQTDSSAYKYRIFGYFLLMDEEWHAQRLQIGFDLDNV